MAGALGFFLAGFLARLVVNCVQERDFVSAAIFAMGSGAEVYLVLTRLGA